VKIAKVLLFFLKNPLQQEVEFSAAIFNLLSG